MSHNAESKKGWKPRKVLTFMGWIKSTKGPFNPKYLSGLENVSKSAEFFDQKAF